MRSSEIRLRKLKLWLRICVLLTTRPPVLPSGSDRFSRSWFFGALVPRIYLFLYQNIFKLQAIEYLINVMINRYSLYSRITLMKKSNVSLN